MSLTFLLGGARSGKSSLAVEIARGWDGPVTFIATGEPGDREMAERIRRHRAERPVEWETIEEPLELAPALDRVPRESAVVIDCLSLWVANLLGRGADEVEIESRARELAAAAAGRESLTVAVSNEVGLGVVPPSELGRQYRDVLGRVNVHWAGAAEQAAFVLAGRMLQLS